MDKQFIINEICRTAKANDGRPLGRERFARETGIQQRDWIGKHWVRWGDALSEAGFQPNKLQSAYDEVVITEKMIDCMRELGKYPVKAELKMKANHDKTFPSHSVFDRVGKKAVFAQKILQYCEGKKGFEDVVEICSPIASSLVKQSNAQAFNRTVGYVYLIKSGRYYKVGKSNAPGRRQYEIGLKLPEEISMIHIIETDDPTGIEEYWHKRFAQKRKKGEWFVLSADDVRAFKWRNRQ